MGEPRDNTASDQSSTSSTPSPPPPPLSLLQPSCKKKNKPKVLSHFSIRFSIISHYNTGVQVSNSSRRQIDRWKECFWDRMTGTLFSYKKGRVSLSVQENRRTLPTLVVELAIQANVFRKEMSVGMVRIALECEKMPDKNKKKVLDEPLWTMFCNGKKTGYGVRREALEEDLYVMEVLKAISTGAGILPTKLEVEGGAEGQNGVYLRTF